VAAMGGQHLSGVGSGIALRETRRISDQILTL